MAETYEFRTAKLTLGSDNVPLPWKRASRKSGRADVPGISRPTAYRNCPDAEESDRGNQENVSARQSAARGVERKRDNAGIRDGRRHIHLYDREGLGVEDIWEARGEMMEEVTLSCEE